VVPIFDPNIIMQIALTGMAISEMNWTRRKFSSLITVLKIAFSSAGNLKKRINLLINFITLIVIVGMNVARLTYFS
jgi:hypothetical protein